MLFRIGLLLFCCTSVFGVETIKLKTPHLSEDLIIGTNVGIRPYRKNGVRIELQSIQDKQIIHNYGYGGSGLTLSFGGAKEVLDILSQLNSSSKTVAILGAGVAGLTTAYDLLEKGYEVHVYSDAWSPHLTSNVAAGIWTPLSLSEDASEKAHELNERMLASSRARFLQSTTQSPEFDGIHFLWYYHFLSIADEGKTTLEGEDVNVQFDNGVVKTAKRRNEIAINGHVFMEDLFSKVKQKGAILHQQRFDSLEDIIALKEPIIINCTGMASKTLFNDHQLEPIRGQLLYLKPQEGVDYLVGQRILDSHYFVSLYPWNDRLIIGGIYEWNQADPHTTPDVLHNLLKNAQDCFSENLK